MVIWMARQLVPRAVPVGWIALLKLYPLWPLCLRGRSDLLSHWDPTPIIHVLGMTSPWAPSYSSIVSFRFPWVDHGFSMAWLGGDPIPMP